MLFRSKHRSWGLRADPFAEWLDLERILSGRDGVRQPHGYLHSLFCKEFEVLPSQLEGEDPELLYRIVQIRGYERMRDRMRTEKERERDADAELQSPVAKLVAKVQYMLQKEDALEAASNGDDEEEEGEQ